MVSPQGKSERKKRVTQAGLWVSFRSRSTERQHAARQHRRGQRGLRPAWPRHPAPPGRRTRHWAGHRHRARPGPRAGGGGGQASRRLSRRCRHGCGAGRRRYAGADLGAGRRHRPRRHAPQRAGGRAAGRGQAGDLHQRDRRQRRGRHAVLADAAGQPADRGRPQGQRPRVDHRAQRPVPGAGRRPYPARGAGRRRLPEQWRRRALRLHHARGAGPCLRAAGGRRWPWWPHLHAGRRPGHAGGDRRGREPGVRPRGAL